MFLMCWFSLEHKFIREHAHSLNIGYRVLVPYLTVNIFGLCIPLWCTLECE